MQSATLKQQIDPAREQQTPLIGKTMHQMPRIVTIALPLKKRPRPKRTAARQAAHRQRTTAGTHIRPLAESSRHRLVGGEESEGKDET